VHNGKFGKGGTLRWYRSQNTWLMAGQFSPDGLWLTFALFFQLAILLLFFFLSLYFSLSIVDLFFLPLRLLLFFGISLAFVVAAFTAALPFAHPMLGLTGKRLAVAGLDNTLSLHDFDLEKNCIEMVTSATTA
jgi:hypothetical protein